MKERPILFSGEMVRAILEGRKTQTRRVVKPQPYKDFAFMPLSTELVGIGSPEKGWVRCPFGTPGDRLWVRETWRAWHPVNRYDEPLEWDIYPSIPAEKGDRSIEYQATTEGPEDIPWRPSIHMPRWASRITLEITGVRVERLRAMSEEDALAEGFRGKKFGHEDPEADNWTNRAAFAEYWDSLSKGEFFWCDNPWVWVIEFKKQP